MAAQMPASPPKAKVQNGPRTSPAVTRQDSAPPMAPPMPEQRGMEGACPGPCSVAEAALEK